MILSASVAWSRQLEESHAKAQARKGRYIKLCELGAFARQYSSKQGLVCLAISHVHDIRNVLLVDWIRRQVGLDDPEVPLLHGIGQLEESHAKAQSSQRPTHQLCELGAFARQYSSKQGPDMSWDFSSA